MSQINKTYQITSRFQQTQKHINGKKLHEIRLPTSKFRTVLKLYLTKTSYQF